MSDEIRERVLAVFRHDPGALYSLDGISFWASKFQPEKQVLPILNSLVRERVLERVGRLYKLAPRQRRQ